MPAPPTKKKVGGAPPKPTAGKAASSPAAPRRPSTTTTAALKQDPKEQRLRERVGDALLFSGAPAGLEKHNLIVSGPKNGGKTSSLRGLPFQEKPTEEHPFRGRFVFISFDGVTENGLSARWGSDTIVKGDPTDPDQLDKPFVIFDVRTPNDEVGYPGWDAGDLSTGTIVMLMARRMLKFVRQMGGAGATVLDHFQAAHETYGLAHAYVLGLGPDATFGAKMSTLKYGPRAQICRDVLSAAELSSREYNVITGYRDNETMIFVEDGVKDDGEPSMKPVMSTEICRWLIKYQDLYHNHIDFWTTMPDLKEITPDVIRETKWYATVIGSKSPIFPFGQTLDITNKDIGEFWQGTEAFIAPQEVMVE